MGKNQLNQKTKRKEIKHQLQLVNAQHIEILM